MKILFLALALLQMAIPQRLEARVWGSLPIIEEIKDGVFFVKKTLENKSNGYKLNIYYFLDCPNEMVVYYDNKDKRFTQRLLESTTDKDLILVCKSFTNQER